MAYILIKNLEGCSGIIIKRLNQTVIEVLGFSLINL
jgi:hypothetical protein